MPRGIHIACVSAVLVCSLFVLAECAYSYEIALYLIPRFHVQSETIELRDIARIETKGIDRELVGSEVIDAKLYEDSFLDRRELIDYVKSRFGEEVHIFGSGVSIVRDNESDASAREHAVMIRKGDVVRYALEKGAIRVEVTGTAMEEGLEGERIQVKLNTKKMVQGKIAAARRVESGQ